MGGALSSSGHARNALFLLKITLYLVIYRKIISPARFNLVIYRKIISPARFYLVIYRKIISPARFNLVIYRKINPPARFKSKLGVNP